MHPLTYGQRRAAGWKADAVIHGAATNPRRRIPVSADHQTRLTQGPTVQTGPVGHPEPLPHPNAILAVLQTIPEHPWWTQEESWFLAAR